MPPRAVFADTFYWVAQTSPRDAAHARVMKYSATLGGCRIITTDEVLDEMLARLASSGSHGRSYAVRVVRAILTDPLVEVVPQDRAGFLDALDLYERRPDKGYSLTDCRSMLVMRGRGISEVLTNDHHFTQEGFTILFP